MAVKPREARESRICCQTDAVDRLFRDLEEKRGDGSEPRVRPEWLNQSLKEIRSRKDVVVEEHEYVPRGDPSRTVARRGEAQIGAELHETDLRERPAHLRDRVIGRAVVHDDDGVRDGLCTQVVEAPPGEVPSVEGRDDDIERQSHALKTFSGTRHYPRTDWGDLGCAASWSTISFVARVGRRAAAASDGPSPRSRSSIQLNGASRALRP